jgi:hypothetical protein
MEATEDCPCGDATASRKLMAVRGTADRIGLRTFRNARSQTRVWPTAIVMSDRLPNNGAEVPLTHRNHEIQAFAADRADQAFAEGIRLWHANRRLEYRQTHRLKASIDTLREDRVAIVDHESVRPIARDDHPKLLRRPIRRRVRRHVPVQNASGADVQDDKHLDHAERGRHCDKEITGEHRSGVVPHEGTPRLCSLFRARWSRRHIPPDRPRRNSEAELHEELGGNPLLAPRPIRGRHHRNELLQVRWNRRPASRARFQPPEQPEPFPMPSNERFRLDNGQQTPPVQEPRQRDEGDARGVIGPAGFCLAFQVQGQLLSQEQVLYGELGT